MSSRSKIPLIAFTLACTLIPLAAYLTTTRLTKSNCEVTHIRPDPICGKGRVCALIDARGRSLCIPEPAELPFELEFPFESAASVRLSPSATHGEVNTLYAIDLIPEPQPPLDAKVKVLAGLDGTAYIKDSCKGNSPECGSGFGNFVQMVDSTAQYTVLYAHLDQILVKNGYPVKAGTVIGTLGSSGRSESASNQTQKPKRWLHWQVNSIQDAPQIPETFEKPAYQTRSVPFRFKKSAQLLEPPAPRAR